MRNIVNHRAAKPWFYVAGAALGLAALSVATRRQRVAALGVRRKHGNSEPGRAQGDVSDRKAPVQGGAASARIQPLLSEELVQDIFGRAAEPQVASNEHTPALTATTEGARLASDEVYDARTPDDEPTSIERDHAR